MLMCYVDESDDTGAACRSRKSLPRVDIRRLFSGDLMENLKVV